MSHVLEVRGVHPIEADEPIHLIDLAITTHFDEVDWSSITQAIPTQPRENWQAAWDERELDALPDGRHRGAFFFHYLDIARPLESSHGRLTLPAPTPVPSDLRAIEYEPPN